MVAVAQISIARRSALVNLDGGPSSASLVSAAGSSSASLSCMCPVHPHMSAGQDFFDNLDQLSTFPALDVENRPARRRGENRRDTISILMCKYYDTARCIRLKKKTVWFSTGNLGNVESLPAPSGRPTKKRGGMQKASYFLFGSNVVQYQQHTERGMQG